MICTLTRSALKLHWLSSFDEFPKLPNEKKKKNKNTQLLLYVIVRHCDTRTYLSLVFWLNNVAHDTNPLPPKAQAWAQNSYKPRSHTASKLNEWITLISTHLASPLGLCALNHFPGKKTITRECCLLDA